ncbi:MAG: hypothetical protein F6K19_50115 [Cyanothece sp. SIO1E1]|nr:hypothetical protein [Cyanothece sp. SIO1E1]
MGNDIKLIVKILLVSAGLAAIIKYICPSLPISATVTNALIAVIGPTAIMAGVLGWRLWQQNQQ